MGQQICGCDLIKTTDTNTNRNEIAVSHSAVSGGDGDSVSRLGESPSQRPSKVPAAYDVDAGAVLDDLVVLGRGQ